MKTETATRIQKFFSSPAIAVIGVSEDEKKFGNKVYRAMRERKLAVYPVNPRRCTVEGVQCCSALSELPEKVKTVLTVVRPPVTEQIVEECVREGISIIWMQPGSESRRAIVEAERNGISVISGECIFMYLEPVVSAHAVHRWFRRIFGTYPA